MNGAHLHPLGAGDVGLRHDKGVVGLPLRPLGPLGGGFDLGVGVAFEAGAASVSLGGGGAFLWGGGGGGLRFFLGGWLHLMSHQTQNQIFCEQTCWLELGLGVWGMSLPFSSPPSPSSSPSPLLPPTLAHNSPSTAAMYPTSVILAQSPALNCSDVCQMSQQALSCSHPHQPLQNRKTHRGICHEQAMEAAQ